MSKNIALFHSTTGEIPTLGDSNPSGSSEAAPKRDCLPSFGPGVREQGWGLNVVHLLGQWSSVLLQGWNHLLNVCIPAVLPSKTGFSVPLFPLHSQGCHRAQHQLLSEAGGPNIQLDSEGVTWAPVRCFRSTQHTSQTPPPFGVHGSSVLRGHGAEQEM